MPEAPLILCVDDNEAARYALARTLERSGFRVQTASTGREALEKAREGCDAVVLDVQLPDLDGYEVCQRLKADPQTSTLPILQVSADFVDVEHRAKGLELGADAYLARPLEPPELIATIRSLLRARHAEEAARIAARQLQTTFDSISDGICLLDADGRVVRCNREMTRLLGLSEGQVVGRSHESFLPATGAGAASDPFRRMVQSRGREVQTIRHGERWFRVTCDPVLDDRGGLTGAVYVFSDVTERQQVQEERERLLAREQGARAEAQSALSQLRASEQRLRRLSEANMFGVVEAELDGGLRWANDAFLRLVGRPREALEAGLVRWDRATPPEWHEADARATEELLSRGTCTPFEKEFLRPDGTRVPVYIGATMMHDQPRAICFVLDLSLLRRLEGELREKVAELEVNDRRKDEFLAMLAHELRNPLAAITASLQVLDEVGGTGERPRRLRGTILRQTAILTRLVDDLLDVSRITRGKVELRRERVRAQDVVQHATATARPLLEERRHELAVSLAPEELWLQADATRLEQAISNLLHNAAKYTEPGGRIELSLARDRNQAVVRVRDTGIGIDPQQLERVFELFAQVDQSPARTRGGLGVGLTLVKRLVELHGGAVRARSEGLNRGSEFELRLPLAQASEAHPGEGPAASPAEGAERRRILLVEDNPDIGETLRDLLQLLGNRVELAGDGLRGVQMALASLPEVALVDIGLPGIDGYEVARRLRATEAGRGLLLVALTGYGRPEDRARALEAGFDAHLVKPVDPEELLRLLGRLEAKRSAGGPQQPEAH